MEVYEKIKSDIGFLIIFMFIIAGVTMVFDIGVDDTDKSGSNRSGMSLHTDYKTGLQYLSKSGALIPRLDINGKHMRVK